MKFPKYEYTDLGNAKRWIDLFSKHHLKIPELGEWYFWNGVLWVQDIHGKVISETINQFLDSLKAESDEIAAEHARLKSLTEASPEENNNNAEAAAHSIEALEALYKACTKWYKACQSKGRIDSLLSLASKLGASKSYEEFDSKGKYLGVKNGAIKLTTGSYVTNDPSYLITKSTNAAFEPEATCPNWTAFLNTIFQGDQELIGFIQRVAGESLIGERCKTKLIMFTGDGANGKSTFVDSLMLMMGDYAITSSPDAITTGNSSNDYYLADMKGARMSILNESRANARLDNQMVKQLVDSGKVQARQIYGKPFTFQPVATPILTTNNPPVISSEYAINRRLLCVHFNYQIPVEDRNPNFISESIEPELSGILNWALEGCRQYLEQGLNPPESVLKTTREYIFEHDRVLKYVTENFDQDAGRKIPAKEFYGAYVRWCGQHDYEVISSKQLNQELRGMGYPVRISTGNVFYVFGLSKKHFDDANVVSMPTKAGDKSALLEVLET